MAVLFAEGEHLRYVAGLHTSACSVMLILLAFYLAMGALVDMPAI